MQSLYCEGDTALALLLAQYTIVSAHTYPQVMVCLQVLLVSHHHLIISHPLLLLLLPLSSYQQVPVYVIHSVHAHFN